MGEPDKPAASFNYSQQAMDIATNRENVVMLADAAAGWVEAMV